MNFKVVAHQRESTRYKCLSQRFRRESVVLAKFQHNSVWTTTQVLFLKCDIDIRKNAYANVVLSAARPFFQELRADDVGFAPSTMCSR